MEDGAGGGNDGPCGILIVEIDVEIVKMGNCSYLSYRS
jgi:hypothetical protein